VTLSARCDIELQRFSIEEMKQNLLGMVGEGFDLKLKKIAVGAKKLHECGLKIPHPLI
jgi:hypothetical protein